VGSVQDDLRCLVSAPVNYVAQDFVLHLFATFCRAVIQSYEKEGKTGRAARIFRLRRIRRLAVSVLWRVVVYGGIAAALLLWQTLIAHHIGVSPAWVRYAAFAVIGLGALDLIRSLVFKVRRWSRGEMGVLEATARRHLSQVRYLQTYTTGWTGVLSFPGGSQGQFSRGVSRAEQPLSYPDIVSEFRNFARRVADEAHRTGYRVFIGVDELDKIGSAEQAERFLNEIKGIFGIPHLYFMVSVSDDALTSFERRGLPLRDAFDSSFDEIVHVGPLSYLESRRLLYRRVVGLSEPYVALCHCLSGGLARDLIRAARNVVRTAATLMSQPAAPPEDYFAPPATENVEYGEYLEDVPLERFRVRELSLGAISSAVIRGELLRKLQAISRVAGAATPGRTTELQDDLNDAARLAAREGSVKGVVGLMTKPGLSEAAALADLRFDCTAYAYYCATLQDVFTDDLDNEQIVRASSDSRGPASFDALAGIRNALGLDTMLAWQMISHFRAAWGSLDTLEPPHLDPRRRRRRSRSAGAAGEGAPQPGAVRPVKAS
jgi:prepilin signal peptidase PulO-like enzyme (type II secretory pathway)